MARDYRDRLEDAIAGERLFWHYVEVRPDDVKAALDALPILNIERLAGALHLTRHHKAEMWPASDACGCFAMARIVAREYAEAD